MTATAAARTTALTTASLTSGTVGATDAFFAAFFGFNNIDHRKSDNRRQKNGNNDVCYNFSVHFNTSNYFITGVFVLAEVKAYSSLSFLLEYMQRATITAAIARTAIPPKTVGSPKASGAVNKVPTVYTV